MYIYISYYKTCYVMFRARTLTFVQIQSEDGIEGRKPCSRQVQWIQHMRAIAYT